MKKIIAGLFLATTIIMGCKTNSQDEKIDLTKSYESAALALTNAEAKYNAALATNDSTQIATAKAELETAKANYINSKNKLVAGGGTVNATYESVLTKTNNTLTKATTDSIARITGKNVASKVVSAASNVDSIKNNLSKKATSTVQSITEKKKQAENAYKTEKENVTKKIKSTSDNINKTKSDAKKKVEDLKKDAESVKSLFK